MGDLVAQLRCKHWDAVLLQEATKSEQDTYRVIEGGHALFLGACGDRSRRVGVLLHKRWLDLEAKLTFSSVGPRISCLNLDAGTARLCLTAANLPHTAYSDDDYDSILMILEDVGCGSGTSR